MPAGSIVTGWKYTSATLKWFVVSSISSPIGNSSNAASLTFALIANVENATAPTASAFLSMLRPDFFMG